MASSSESWKHDVFLSFRGADTRNTFVNHLYSAIVQLGVRTCFDDEETLFLEQSISKAIEESQIAVIVFSQNYADSSWCLDELAHIMKCKDERGQIVIPIYHHTDPSEVGEQKGRYGKALARHELENKNVESWRKALMDVSNLSGWETKYMATRREERLVIKEVVNSISNKLFPNKARVEIGTNHLKIPIQEIILATNNFFEANIIARSGFGKVYKGQSVRLGIVAIKKLDRMHGQGDGEFMMEISLLSICKHENVVSLVGFCDEGGEKILVYKYEQNGSLDRLLHSKDLTWMHRLQILFFWGCTIHRT